MLELRKVTVLVDDVRIEAGRSDGEPVRRVAVMAAVSNPLAGAFRSDLASLIEAGRDVGDLMARCLLEQFGNDHTRVESYGKGAIVGDRCEIEHGFALITRPFAKAVRAALGEARAWMPANVKRGTVGTVLDVPLAHKNALYVRSHYDTIEVSMPGAPISGEIVIVLGAANRGRLHARIGGLTKQEVKGYDTYVDRE